MLTVTKKFNFCYGRCLPNHPGIRPNVIHFSSNVVEIEITRRGCLNKNSMVIDFGDLKKIVDPILEKLDHRYLNDVLLHDYLPPTVENITMYIKEELDNALSDDLTLIRVRVNETPTSWAEWTWNYD